MECANPAQAFSVAIGAPPPIPFANRPRFGSISRRMKSRYLLAFVALVFVFASCSSPEVPSTASRSSAAAETSEYASPPRDRPGLGTKWGETRNSRVTATKFLRANQHPLARAAIYYNDAAGI